MARGKKNANGSGTDARKRKDGRYETRATLDTPTGRRRVSFYGRSAEEANNAKFQALADQARGVLFSDPQRLTVSEYLEHQRQQAAWLMSLAELREALKELEDNRKTAEDELAALKNTQERITQERIEELKEDRDALLETLSGRVPGDLDNLTGDKRARVYRMLRLEVSLTPQGGYYVSGMFCSEEPSSAAAFT